MQVNNSDQVNHIQVKTICKVSNCDQVNHVYAITSVLLVKISD